jgi:NAD(P)-dependent dehydrogenase (short-subunit alcohol dehydrogenase family)
MAGLVVGAAAIARIALRRARRIELRDRVIVITGGSRGLGLVLAREAVRKGARVAICARDGAELERARVELAIMGGTVLASTCDVTDRDDVMRFIMEVRDELGPIDVLVNNAGVVQVGPLELMSFDDFERGLATHLWGPLYAMTAVLPDMRARKSGRIVNIASIGGKLAIPHLAPYTASKFALYGLSTGARAELMKDNIYVTTVCPGLMRTGSPRHALVKGQQSAEYAWFEIMDSLPLTSMSAERAAQQILRATELGDAEVTLSLQAKLAAKLHALAPNLVQDMLAIVNHLLPSAAGGSRVAIAGKDIETTLAPSALTGLSEAAARRNNEV